jgi:ADP-heptose:LPS heptosyltransferase
MNASHRHQTVLVHVTAGIGNIVLATPLLIALDQMGFVIDVLIEADYPQTGGLLRNWCLVREIYEGYSQGLLRRSYDLIIPAAPPFDSRRFTGFYRGTARLVQRPPDQLFYQDEQEYYLGFARALGFPQSSRPFYRLPIAPSDKYGVTARTLVILPGCKTGRMAAKRWPHFGELAEAFEDVAVVGTTDDLKRFDGSPFRFPPHARLFIDYLSLRETAELLAGAGAVVGNDSGLSHIAGAVGAPTFMLFGPTPHRTLGHFPPNVKVMRAGLECEPCWFQAHLKACNARVSCLQQLPVEAVEAELRATLM